MEARGSLKRSAEGDPPGAPDAKRARLTDISSPPLFDGIFGSMDALDSHTLKLQNRELVAKLRQLKSEVDRVSNAQRAAEEAQLRAQKQVNSMAGCWDQLVSDLGLIAGQLGLDSSADSSAIKSDFYSSLLSPLSLNKSGDSMDVDTTEDVMAKYSKMCQTSFTAIVQSLKQHRADSERIIAAVGVASSDSQVQALQSELAVLKQERTNLIKQNEELLNKERQRKRVESELRREAENARAAEKVAVENAASVKAALAERVRQFERLAFEYESLQRKSKDAIAWREAKEAEEAEKAAKTETHEHGSNGTSAGPADPAVRAELEETKARLTSQEQELNALRESKKKVIVECEQLRAIVHGPRISEQDIEQLPLVRNLRQQLSVAQTERQNMQKDVDYYRRNTYDSDSHRASSAAKDVEHYRSEARSLRDANDDRMRAYKQLESERDRLKYELDQAKNHQHSVDTVRNLLDSVQRLQTERERAVKDLSAAREEVQKLKVDVERLSTSDTKALVKKMASLEQQLQNARENEQRVTHKIAEQEALVKAYKMGKTPQANELFELQARVHVLQDENYKLRAASSGSQDASGISQLKSELEQERQNVQSLEKQLETYASELESVAVGFEELNSLNEKIQQQLVQAEEANMAIKAETRKADHAQMLMQKENQTLSERIRSLEQKLSAQTDLYRQETKKNQLLAESAQHADQAAKSLQMSLDEQKSVNRNLLAVQDLLTQQVAELSRQYKALSDATAQFRLETEDSRSTISKLKEERDSLTSKLQRSQKGGLGSSGSLDARLKEELELYKNYYYCSVCHVNRNDTVLSQCGHITCRECVDKNVKSRSRKCPACSKNFATADIIPVYYFS